jgi:uncharacterized protein YjbI with pentapeptide repeats
MWTAILSFFTDLLDGVPAPLGMVLGVALSTAATVIWFFRTQLRLKTSRTTPARAWVRLALAILLCVWVWRFFFYVPYIFWSSPWIFDFPIRQTLGREIVGLFLIAVGLSWIYHFVALENGSNKFWLRVLHFHERICLWLLGSAWRNTYHWHMRWRFELWGHIMAERWQEGRIKRWLLHQRWLWVLFAGLGSLSVLLSVMSWLNDSKPLHDILREVLFPGNTNTDKGGTSTTVIGGGGSAGAWTVFSAFVAAPIAYVLWWFRDTNQLWLIENNRKDTNLKDFQQLCEWASGESSSDGKVVYTKPWAENPSSDDTTNTIPISVSESTPFTNLSGSKALQIAAIHQLRNYAVGEYGKHFQKPTFILLISLWEQIAQSVRSSAVQELTSAAVIPHNEAPQSWYQRVFEPWHRLPLPQSISEALLTERGRLLRGHHELLPKRMLAGINTDLAYLSPVRLTHLDLSGVELQGAKLSSALLQLSNFRLADFRGTDLSYAQLQGAHLSNANFIGADLTSANLNGCHFFISHFEFAKLQNAELNESNMNYCYLSNASLFSANMQRSSLDRAWLFGTNLGQTKLQGASFISPKIDEETRFHGAVTDSSTHVEIRFSGQPEYVDNPCLNVLTHALRLKLRNVNGLVLDPFAYLQFEALWNALSTAKQDELYSSVYSHSANLRKIPWHDEVPKN